MPVVQLSINGLKPLEYHVELGARLAPLRERGIALVGSGNVVHNLRLIDRGQVDTGFAWAHRFDDAVHELLATRPGDILSVAQHPDFALAVPTPDHFIPLLYLAGIAAASDAGQGGAARLFAGLAFHDRVRAWRGAHPVAIRRGGGAASGERTGRSDEYLVT